MTHHPASTPDQGAQLRVALTVLVADEPEAPGGVYDIEQRGRRLLARRRLAGAAAAAVLLTGTGLAVGITSLAGQDTGTDPSPPMAAVPPVGAEGAAGGAQLADGFPIDSAVTAVMAALPAGVEVGELPMDIRWQEGGRLDVPLAGEFGQTTLTLAVSGEGCTATLVAAGPLTASELEAVAGAVCTAWAEAGSPEIVPGGPPGEEQPELANR